MKTRIMIEMHLHLLESRTSVANRTVTVTMLNEDDLPDEVGREARRMAKTLILNRRKGLAEVYDETPDEEVEDEA